MKRDQCDWIDPDSLVRCPYEGTVTLRGVGSFCDRHEIDDSCPPSCGFVAQFADEFFPGMFIRILGELEAVDGTVNSYDVMLVERITFGIDDTIDDLDDDLDLDALEDCMDDEDYWKDRLDAISDPWRNARPILHVRHLDCNGVVARSSVWAPSEFEEAKDITEEEKRLASYWELLSWQA